MSLLKLDKVEASYGKLKSLCNVSMEIALNDFVSVLGTNGSGKTTLLKIVSGFLHPSKGTIVFDGEDVSLTPAYKLCKKGISLVPEGRQLFAPLSVKENLLLGAFSRHKQMRKNQINREMEIIYSMFPVLGSRAEQSASTLSGGEQQMLAIGRALMSKPRLLLLDEPSHGLAPLLVKDILRALKLLQEKETLAIILAEQDVRGALKISDHAYVLQNGQIILEGAADELAKNQQIQAIYFGTTESYRRPERQAEFKI